MAMGLELTTGVRCAHRKPIVHQEQFDPVKLSPVRPTLFHDLLLPGPILL